MTMSGFATPQCGHRSSGSSFPFFICGDSSTVIFGRLPDYVGDCGCGSGRSGGPVWIESKQLFAAFLFSWPYVSIVRMAIPCRSTLRGCWRAANRKLCEHAIVARTRCRRCPPAHSPPRPHYRPSAPLVSCSLAPLVPAFPSSPHRAPIPRINFIPIATKILPNLPVISLQSLH